MKMHATNAIWSINMTLTLDKHYIAPQSKYWTGRKDSVAAERFYQIVQLLDLKQDNLATIKKGLVIIGFECDEGVIRNLGRAGAHQGANAIRLQLGKLPYLNQLPIYDAGNIRCLDNDLESAQFALASLIDYCHQHNLKTLILGGGHETAWGHYLGLKKQHPQLGIINFDAHFDLRKNPIATSGTPFLQIAQDKLKLKQPFNYFCYGIQKTANSRNLFETAEQLKVEYLTAKKINQSALSWQLSSIESFLSKQHAIYLSICMDVFSSAIAPGVSAPQPLGLMPWQVLPILNHIIESDKVISMDIVELNPNYDRDDMTGRLASQLAAELVYGL